MSEKHDFNAFEKKRCSQCGKIHTISQMFLNKLKMEYWCGFCVGKEKLKRDNKKYELRLGRDKIRA